MPSPTAIERLEALRQAIAEEEMLQGERIAAALPRHRASAANLAHYLGLRKQDVRRLQLDLASLGLSSLGRCEGHVRDTLRRLSGWLAGERAAPAEEALDAAKAEQTLHANTRALFGPHPPDRHVYVMVTAPLQADARAGWADALLEAGADMLRVNATHESPREWAPLVRAFKARAAALGRNARVFVDLPGPKLRTEIRQTEEAVLHLPRNKDRMGRTLAPTQVLLVAEYRSGPQLPVPREWLERLQAGDVIAFADSAGRPRRLVVSGPGEGGVLAECDRSLYLSSGLALEWRRDGDVLETGAAGSFPRQERELRLAAGDALLINASGQSEDPLAKVLAFPEPQLLEQVRIGDRLILDDGRLVAAAEARRPDGLLCRVKRTVKTPLRLRSGKGIAFPDSEFAPGHLGPQDEAALEFALEHADGVGVSFVNAAGDVAAVGERIRRAQKPGFGMILKLETRGAMRNLAGILFEALKHDPVGLMIARGDLAVELSFERLAEMQEELLWFGEACHLPVIWATQVLDSVAHTGLPTRAEVTDAAMAMRAECVMLNRGPYIAAATRMLVDIIRKMEAHQFKKRALLRPLTVAQSL